MAPALPGNHLYPYRLNEIIKDKVWGGRKLERLLGKRLAPGHLVGETWDAWEGCTIGNGPLAGEKLAGAIARDPMGVLGSSGREGRFPLLLKYIDAGEDLSVQVHPDDRQAQAMEHYPFGKTEAWYILDAEPDASVIFGLARDAGPEEVARGIEKGTLMDLLASVPVHRGDTLFVPAGTVHAIRKGVVLVEIEENSDITYRMYDWGRNNKERPLHIAQSMLVAHLARAIDPKTPSLPIEHPTYIQRLLVACRYFALELLEVTQSTEALELKNQFHILSVIQGQGQVRFGRDHKERVDANLGLSVVVPAGLESYALVPSEPVWYVLRAYLPDLRVDIVDPLVRAGYGVEAIARLGGWWPSRNDLLPLLKNDIVQNQNPPV